MRAFAAALILSVLIAIPAQATAYPEECQLPTSTPIHGCIVCVNFSETPAVCLVWVDLRH
jgi:hypothetical protein